VKDNCSLFAPTPYFRASAIRWCHLNFFLADPRCYGNEFWNKTDYNSAHAKDNCTLFSPNPLFSNPRYSMVPFEFFPWRPLLPWQRILGQKLTTARPSWKISARCFYIHLYFCARFTRWCHLNFSLADCCCHGDEFWDKTDYNSAHAKDNCTLFSPNPLFLDPRYSIVLFEFSRDDPCGHDNEFWDKNWLYTSALVKNNCALFLPTPLFLCPVYPTLSSKFFPTPTPVAMATNSVRNLRSLLENLKFLFHLFFKHITSLGQVSGLYFSFLSFFVFLSLILIFAFSPFSFWLLFPCS